MFDDHITITRLRNAANHIIQQETLGMSKPYHLISLGHHLCLFFEHRLMYVEFRVALAAEHKL